MATPDTKKVEERRKKVMGSEEFENFTTLIDDVRPLYMPDYGLLRSQVAKGTKLNNRRVSDVGILMTHDYAAGVQSETVTSGEQWFEYHDRTGDKKNVDMMDAMTKICYDRVNNSNFNTQFNRDLISSAVDGTSCMYVERVKGKLNFVHVPFGNFWFTQDYRDVPDTVWIERTTTPAALIGEFGDNVSEKCKRDYEKNPEMNVKIIHYCAPRLERDGSKLEAVNKPYELLTYEQDGGHLLEEGGTDLQKFMVYRVKRIGSESLGRGPAIDTVCSMYAVERCAKDMQRGLRQSVVPMYAVGASMGQSGFRVIHNDDSSIMVYNDTGIASPPQTLNPPINVEFGQAYMEWMIKQMRSLFFLDYFNPVMDKKNITATQTREIVNKSQQMVDQVVGPLKEERLDPLLQWVMILLGEAGEFAEWGSWSEIQGVMKGKIRIRYKSMLANAQKRIRLMSIIEYTEAKGMIAQSIPDPVMQYEFLAQTDWSLLPQELIDGTNAPQILLRDPDEAKAMAQQFAEAQAKQAEMENVMKAADAASKASGAVDPTSVVANM